MINEEIEKKAREHSIVYDTKYAEDGVLEDMLSRPQDFVDGAIMDIVQLLRKKANRDGFITGAKEMLKENEQLNVQIEKMKNHTNCKFYHEWNLANVMEEPLDDLSPCQGCKNFSLWELAE